ASNIYLMEFKMSGAQDALDQIKEKKYYEKYLGQGKEIILIGTGFDPETRNIGQYLIEKLS
ncbi:MAG: AAA family ATPase, partial [bacterium]|nr:AAA family ATPase [bacterium]